jgi:hypothetical protein
MKEDEKEGRKPRASVFLCERERHTERERERGTVALEKEEERERADLRSNRSALHNDGLPLEQSPIQPLDRNVRVCRIQVLAEGVALKNSGDMQGGPSRGSDAARERETE